MARPKESRGPPAIAPGVSAVSALSGAFFFVIERFGGDRHVLRGFDMGLILTSEK